MPGPQTVAVLDAFGGLAGDMFLGALLDLGRPEVDAEALEAALRSLALPGWTLRVEAAERRHLGCTKVDFDVADEKDHRHLPEIVSIIESSELPAGAKARALGAFHRLAVAEAKAHRIDLERVHFHEVGAADAILDICGVSWALDRLGVERVYAGPMPAGSGTVKCMHGEMPVPVPAVVELLGDFELQLGVGQGEMITPTGAALLVEWGEPAPAELRVRGSSAGYGAGTRATSLCRVVLGQADLQIDADRDEVWVFETHIDDMRGEALAFLGDRLLEAGALDFAYAPVVMKKGRPAHALTVMVGDAAREAVAAVLFSHSTTLGIRERRVGRRLRAREAARVETPLGPVDVKIVGGEARPEFESLATLARTHELSLAQVEAGIAEALARATKSRGQGDA